MRSMLIIAGVIVVLAGIFLYMNNNETETPRETTTGMEEQMMDMEMEAEIESEENAAMDMEMETEAESGTDIGMEFPDIDEGTEGAKIFDLSGRNFAFSQNEIRVNQGDTVTINFTSTEGFHDFVVDEFNARTNRVNTGESTSVTFVADQTGTFEYYCSVGQHRANGMVGSLIVE